MIKTGQCMAKARVDIATHNIVYYTLNIAVNGAMYTLVLHA